VHFQTRAQQSSVPELANAPPTGMTYCPFLEDEHWHFPFNLALAGETMEEQLVDVPVS
jgi:hypothetical protein